MIKKFPKVIFHVILGQYDPLKSPLHYQQSMLKRLYSPKILNKIVLPEMDSFLSFLKWECSKSDQNVIFHAILANYGTIRPI